MGRSSNIWSTYYTYCESSFCPRGGTVACKVLPPFKVRDNFPYNCKPEFVSEHMGRSAYLLGLFLMSYPDLTDSDTWFLQVMFELAHDAGEYKNGDMLDDDSISPEGLAAIKEEEIHILEEMFLNYPGNYGMQMIDMLPKFEGYTGGFPLFDKMVEKLDAILFQIFLYSKGIPGDIRWKEPKPSKRDLRFAKIIGSYRVCDVWAFHFRVATKHAPLEYQKPLRKVLEVAFKSIYGTIPPCMTIDVTDVPLHVDVDYED